MEIAPVTPEPKRGLFSEIRRRYGPPAVIVLIVAAVIAMWIFWDAVKEIISIIIGLITVGAAAKVASTMKARNDEIKKLADGRETVQERIRKEKARYEKEKSKTVDAPIDDVAGDIAANVGLRPGRPGASGNEPR